LGLLKIQSNILGEPDVLQVIALIGFFASSGNGSTIVR